MIFPGSFHVPGHSGTDVKHRKAFAKQKAQLKKEKRFKKTEYKNDERWQKKANVKERKKSGKIIMFFVGIVFAVAVPASIYLIKTVCLDNIEILPNEAGILVAQTVYHERETNNAYYFLVGSGEEYLNSDMLDEAQWEFVRALKVYEYGKDARIGLTKVLIKKCKLSGELCNEMEEHIEFLVESEYVSLEEIKEW